ncbi:MAG: hypothetical protein V3G42_10990 [Oscillospiraceae bacterium]
MKDKTIPNASPKRVKGTVLFTVVAVMMVLIVFLMSVLSLAAAANNRANANYQKAQTEIIARTVLDAAVRSIEEDETVSGIRKDVISENDITVTLEGVAYTVEVANAGYKRSYYNDTLHSWEEGDIYQLSVTVDKTRADTTYTAFVTAKTETTPPTDNDDGYGAFVSMGGTSTIGTGGFITGGTYVGIDPALPPPASGHYTVADNEALVDVPYYINGDVWTGGGQGLGLHFTAPGEKFVVVGSFLENKANQFKTDYTGFNWNKTTLKYNTDTPYIYIEGTMKLHDNSKTRIGSTVAPTNVYCGNLESGQIQIYGDIYTFDPNKDSYTGNSGVVSSLYKWADSSLTISDNPNGSDVYGSWFSKGNITYHIKDSIRIEGDIRSEKDITFNGGGGNLDIGGDIVCNGTLYLNNANINCRNIYASKIVKTYGNINCTSSQSFEESGGMPNWTQYTGGGTKIGEKTTTYTLKNDDGYVNGIKISYGNEYGNQFVLLETNYTSSVVQTVNGVTTSTPATPIVESTRAFKWEIDGYDWSMANIEDFVNAGRWAKYENLKSTLNAAAAGSVTEDILDFDITSKLPAGVGPIYPDEYDSTNVKTTIKLEAPQPDDYSSMKTDSSTFLPNGQMFDGNLSAFSSGSEGTSPYYIKDGCYVVENACHFKNISFDRNLYIKPKGDFKVVLENCSMGSNRSIIADDSHEVTLYIIGQFNIPNNGGIFTEWYWNNMVGSSLNGNFPATTGSTLDIKQMHTSTSDGDYPNLIINSDAGAEMHLNNQTCVTAMVRAPQMLFQQSQGFTGGFTINYENAYGGIMKYIAGGTSQAMTWDGQGDAAFNKTKLDTVGVVGQLIAEEIQLNNSRNWGMIYVTVPNLLVPTPPSPGSTNPFAGESTILGYDYY